MLKLTTEGYDAPLPLDPDAVEFEDISERGCPVGDDITPPVPEPVELLPEMVEFQTSGSEGELLDPVPDGVIIPSDSHPELEAPLTVVT
jgi:hypothetical protein